MAAVAIEIVPCLKDNYAYLVHDADSGLTAIVDPSEPDPVDAALARKGWKLSYILNTHHHFDHTGGNLPLKEKHGARVVGPRKDAERIAGIDDVVDETAPWRFGSRDIPVLEIPAHTRAHIAFVFDDAVFTGDTLFAMGCGRLLEGTPQMMWTSMSKLTALPDATRVYCGHEYTQSNGRFALTLEPGNTALVKRMEEVNETRQAKKPSVPSNMALEKRTNPFLRPDSKEIRKSLGMDDADNVTVFAEIRRRKNSF